MEIRKLHDFIRSYYSLDELRTLCLELGIEYEDLGGRTRNAKARDLVLLMGRERRLDDLIIALENSRSNLFLKSGIDTSDSGLVTAYAELDDFAEATRPVSERLMGRLAQEQRVWFVVLALLVLAGAIGLYLGLREVGPDQMSGEFNIAVAPFEIVDGVPAERGQDIANTIFGRLLANLEEVESPVIQVWGPSEPRLRPIPRINGRNEAERSEKAAELAQSIGADLIIYGIVDIDGGNWEVTPEFSVTSRNFDEASEILGHHNLGEAFGVPGDDPLALRVKAGDTLKPRTEIVAQIAIALTYYSIAEYERASAIIRAVAEREDLAEEDGLQVVYLLLANALGKQAAALRQDNAADKIESAVAAEALLQEAIFYYEEAARLDPEYSRAYAGLGNAQYLMALGDGSSVDEVLLQDSIDVLEAALNASNKPPNSFVETKIHSSLGHSYLLFALVASEPEFNEAIREFERVIADYEQEEEPPAILREMAGEAYARLGLIQARQARIADAIASYETAASLLYDRPDRQELYASRAEDLRSQ